MLRGFKAALIGAALVLGGVANAHDLSVLKLVNGQPTAEVFSYPTTLNFSHTVTNTHPTLPSELLTATDPLFQPLGWTFTPAPPLELAVGESVTYNFPVTINSFDDCIQFAANDEDPNTTPPQSEPAPRTVPFTNIVHITWDSGSAQSSVQVLCHEVLTLPCDTSLYLSTGLPTTTLARFDPMGGGLVDIHPTGIYFNAMGFNHLDGFLYALNVNPGVDTRLIKMGADGVPIDLGALPLPPYGWAAGAILENGNLAVYEQGIGMFAIIDTVTATVVQQGLVPNPGLFQIADWAVNPTDGKLYAYNHQTDRMTTFDPLTGTNTDFGPLAPLNTGGILDAHFIVLSAFFDGTGQLYLYGSDFDVGDGTVVNSLYAVHLGTSGFTKVVTGPPVSAADGASCAFNTTPGVVPTRTEGFYKTHEKATQACLDQGRIDLGDAGEVKTLPEAMALLWASPSVDAKRRARTEAERLETELAREALTGVCNQRLFGKASRMAPETAVLSRALRALNDFNLVPADRGLLDALRASNEAGATRSLPLLFDTGKATPRHAAELAHTPEKAR